MKYTKDRTFLAYFESLTNVKLLTAEEERALLERYYKNNDLEARNRVIESCLRFVVKLATRFAANVDELKQLISAGNEGLLVALDKFDIKRDVRFLSYATYWALLYIRCECNNIRNVVSIPSWYSKLLQQINNFHMEVLSSQGRLATNKEICAKFKISERQLKNLEKINYQELVPTIMREHENVEQHFEQKELRQKLDFILSTRNANCPFSRRELFILRAYFGFIDGTPWTLGQLANYLGMSSERVRQIKERALATLRGFVSLLVNEIPPTCPEVRPAECPQQR